MSYDPVLQQLIDDLCCLPGVGQKTAQRMAFHLLQRDRAGGQRLAASLKQALAQIQNCQQCRSLSSQPICPLCANPKRNRQQLCVVENPADLLAIEQTAIYQGLYFVLGGRLSPLDGIGPEQLGLEELKQRVERDQIQELILAISATVEGQTTAHYIQNMLPNNVLISRIAHGVPLGGELGYIDQQTLSHAFSGRQRIDLD